MLELSSPLARILFAALAAAIGAYLLFPVAWLVATSLKPDPEIFVKFPSLLPQHPTLDNFARALKASGLGGYLRNSLVTATGSALLTTTLAALAAFGFAKYRFRGRQPLMLLLIAAQMFPFAVLLITLYPMLKAVGLLNTLTGLTLSYIVFALPSGIYILFTFFVQIPDELIESARMDGAGEVTILRRIVLPLALPGLIAVAVYSFMWAWNDLFYSLTIIASKDLRTVGPGLMLEFFGEMQQDWGAAMAASFLASAPVVLLFAFLQRYFIQGLTAGAVKG
jgi:multiple sugar transport system permease protein